MISSSVLVFVAFAAARNGFAGGAENVAQVAVGRVLNSLPEGILLAICAWLLLRLIRGTNAGTRFLVWLTALAGVAALPLLTGLESSRHALGRTFGAVPHAEVTVPGIWAIAFVALWVPIALVALLRLAAGVSQVRSMRRACLEIDHAILDPILRDALAQHGKGRAVRLLVSEKARVPAAIGFRHPAIVLPAWCFRELSAEQLHPILIHEMAHLRRRDDWTNLFQKLARAVFFFHPAVWWIDARLSLEREMACDDAVLAATGDARSYAGSLIGLLERGCAHRGWTMAQTAVARAREASLRIARLLSGKASSTTRVGRGVLGLAAALSVACCGVLAVVPQMVSFAPDAEPMHPTAAANHIGVPIPSGVDLRGSLHGAAVVPVMFHPAAQPANTATAPRLTHPVSGFHARHAKGQNQAESEVAVAQTQAPQVVMANLDQTQHPGAPDRTPVSEREAGPPATQVVMVVETQYVQPGSDAAPAQGSPGSDRLTQTQHPGAAAPQHAIPMQAVQVQTVRVVEQDETGVHVRTWRVVLMIPVLQAGPMQT
ncbi:MAG TPA: M56 family metallopeptidase [Acidobacteriaceae bacterium]